MSNYPSTGKGPLKAGDVFLRHGERFIVVSTSGPANNPELRAVREGSEAHRLAAYEIETRRKAARL